MLTAGVEPLSRGAYRFLYMAGCRLCQAKTQGRSSGGQASHASPARPRRSRVPAAG